MEPRIQYAKTEDGVNISYAVFGQGPPLIWYPDLPNANLRLEWQLPGYRAIFDLLMNKRMLIRLDPRGIGLSDRRIDDFSLDKRLLDILAVVDALGLKRFELFTACRGGPLAVTLASRYPERVSSLILWNTFAAARERLETPRRVLDELLDQDWVLFTETVCAYALGWGDQATEYAEFMRACVTHETARVMYRAFDKDDVTALLPNLRTPTLIIQNDGLRDWTVEMGMNLAARIKNSRLVVIRGTWFDNLGDVANALDDFLGEGEEVAAPVPASTGLVTILFTDIESSTALRRRLGDAKAQDLLRTHNTIVREAVKSHAGSEVKHTGDGIMASFSTASGALECAIAIQKGIAAHVEQHPDAPLAVYIGLNAGEPIAEESDLFGTSVDLARRICDNAQPGQILASDLVVGLAAGKGFVFEDQGEASLKGFDRPARLYGVRWREEA